jgi:hypothetical protein
MTADMTPERCKDFWRIQSIEDIIEIFKEAPHVASAWYSPHDEAETELARTSLSVGWHAGYIFHDYELVNNDIVMKPGYEWHATSVPSRNEDWTQKWENISGKADTLEDAQKACDAKLIELGWLLVR